MEIIYGEWRKIDSLCINCAIPLESRPAAWGLLVIAGINTPNGKWLTKEIAMTTQSMQLFDINTAPERRE